MISAIFLTLHIAGAIVTLIIASYSTIVLWNTFHARYRACASILGALAGFEVITGVMLSIISPQITAFSLCKNIVLYLSLVVILEIILCIRMRKTLLTFPWARVLSPILTSLFAFGVALSFGF